ncbi:hypothetical protein E7Z59_14535 [Robertkochia marina]|uniref:Uncharacterized protein n=1 Tax=Robertkochia marina TaxID=1227945 RepID=A0A4S3LZT3_9FLAO|nr:hypothetical protein [Robertkochia marina]THD65799.1 hypothetical protein E7Z59_14535 [Robertkochia marina]TRZ46515.1 hypothetical protein D3A96_02805 [Robertkochia marina]
MLRLIGYLAITLLNQLGFLSSESTKSPVSDCAAVVCVSGSAEHNGIINESGCLLKENSEITRECKYYDVY